VLRGQHRVYDWVRLRCVEESACDMGNALNEWWEDVGPLGVIDAARFGARF